MKILLCCVCLLLISTQLNGEIVKRDNVLLQVNKIINRAFSIEFTYQVKNKSNKIIWVCEQMDWKKDKYESIIHKKEKKVRFKIRSFIVPKNILLEEPIYAKYHKILPGKLVEFILRIDKPFYNRSPLKIDKNNVLDLNSIDIIIFEIGYFLQDLSRSSECCIKTDNPDELLVNCFWAEMNNEAFVSTEMEDKWKNNK